VKLLEYLINDDNKI
jgi:hypothetical protein